MLRPNDNMMGALDEDMILVMVINRKVRSISNKTIHSNDRNIQKNWTFGIFSDSVVNQVQS